MHKPLTLLFFLFAIILCLIVSSDVATQSNVGNEVEGVESVTLEMDKIIFCPWSREEEGNCDKKRKIEVSVLSPKAEKEGLDYYYLVDGGEIIGKGANVVWDFTGARAGDYSITIAVGKDGIIKGNFITKQVIAESCGCYPPCICPSITVLGPETFKKRGDILIFTAEVRGAGQEKTIYKWQVSEGTIIVGQGTKQILVKTNKNSNAEMITATLEVDGQCFDCPREFSASTQFKPK